MTTTDLTKLTVDQIDAAFANSGYDGLEIDNVEFIKFNSDNDAVYICAFIHEGRAELGYLYIKQVDGVLKGEF